MPAPAAASAVPLDLVREVEAMHAASFGWALACCGRRHDDASEVLQQAYCRVLSGQARFDGRSTLRTWLFGVIRVCARERSRWWRLDRLFETSPEPASGAVAADERLAVRQQAEALSRALARLAARQREVLHLVFYEDVPVAEAAGIMGVSVGAARQHYDRGKKHLARILDAEGGPP